MQGREAGKVRDPTDGLGMGHVLVSWVEAKAVFSLLPLNSVGSNKFLPKVKEHWFSFLGNLL